MFSLLGVVRIRIPDSRFQRIDCPILIMFHDEITTVNFKKLVMKESFHSSSPRPIGELVVMPNFN